MGDLLQPLGWHITLRLEDGRNLARNVAERRVLARLVLEAGHDRGLFLFRVPDTHVHVATTALRAEAGRLAHAIECAMRHELHLPSLFEPARFRPISQQSHLANTVPYTLGNGRRHGNRHDPRGEGSNLPDLLGLRMTGRYTAWRLAALLPRLDRRELLALLGTDELQPGRDCRLLADAAAASIAAPSLRTSGKRKKDAVTAAVHLAARMGLSISATAQSLEFSVRSVSRQRLEEPIPELMRAIELQLGLMERIPVAQPQSASFVREVASGRSYTTDHRAAREAIAP